MYEKELKRAERLLENEFGTEWKKIVQTLGVWDLTHCIGRDLTSFIAYPERGSGGSSNWQGNCSPEVIRQITQYVRECQTHRRKLQPTAIGSCCWMTENWWILMHPELYFPGMI